MSLMLNVTSLPSILKVTSLDVISITSFPVMRNGLPSKIGASVSSSMSMMTKSTGKSMSFTITSTSSRIPYGQTLVRSAKTSVILIGFTALLCIFRSIESGIRFTLAPRTSSALPISTPLMVHGIVKLPGSLHLWGCPF
ncbi:hypothetical protein QL285_081814 [Trifolium repens]|nr:hypothetical protein QL285_081814 [Trifolium repens]